MYSTLFGTQFHAHSNHGFVLFIYLFVLGEDANEEISLQVVNKSIREGHLGIPVGRFNFFWIGAWEK